MASTKDTKVEVTETEEKTAANTVSVEIYNTLKANLEKVTAERDKYKLAINKLINSMAQRYAQDLADELLKD